MASLSKSTLYEFFTERMGMSGKEATALVNEVEESRVFDTEAEMAAATLLTGNTGFAIDTKKYVVFDGTEQVVLSSGGTSGPNFDQVIEGEASGSVMEYGAFYIQNRLGAGEALTLPTAVSAVKHVVKVRNQGDHPMVINRPGGEKINGSENDYSLAPNTSIEFTLNGVDTWWT